jgi:hypothetical protein
MVLNKNIANYNLLDLIELYNYINFVFIRLHMK